MKKSIEKALNDQLNREMFSFTLYFAMSQHFQTLNLLGCAHWMFVQAQEELNHVYKFAAFLNARNSAATMEGVDKPQSRWDSPAAVFESALEHERKITQWVDKLVDLAVKEKDHAAAAFLQWFVNEQVEEVSAVDAIVNKFKWIKDSPAGIYLLDRELAQRTLAPQAGE